MKDTMLVDMRNVLLGVFLFWALPGFAELSFLQPSRLLVSLVDSPFQDESPVLPYRWDERHRVPGRIQFHFELPAMPYPQKCGLYIPRMGSEFKVLVNKKLAASYWHELPDEYGFMHRQPHHVDLSSHLNCTDPDNHVEIFIKARPGFDDGLSNVGYGDVDTSSKYFKRQEFWEITVNKIVAAVSMTLTVLGLILWTMTRDRLYLYYGLAEGMWSLGLIFHLSTDISVLPIYLHGFMMMFCTGAGVMFMCWFCLSLVSIEQKDKDKLTFTQKLLACVWCLIGGLIYIEAFRWAYLIWGGLHLTLGLITCAYVGWSIHRKPQTENVICGVALSLPMVAGLMDWSTDQQMFETGRWLPVSWIAMGLVMVLLIGQRMRQSANAVAEHEVILKQRLHERETELSEFHSRKQVSAAMHASQQERQRVLRDMHDGLGTDLLAALMQARALEKQSSLPISMAPQIQRALDHLKISIDVFQEDHGDIATIVGQLRHRMGMQFEAAGIALIWRVEDLPVVTDWHTDKSRDLTFLLYEAFSNLLMHSGATQAWFEVTHHDLTIHITLSDNGRGMPNHSAQSGHGLRNMQERAHRLNAKIAWDRSAEHGGTQLILTVPVFTSHG